MTTGSEVSRLAVGAHAKRAGLDLEQLLILIDDPAVVSVTPEPVLRITTRAIRDAQDSLTALRAALDDEPAPRLWKRMRQRQTEVDGLVAECLTLATGSMLRERGTDQGMCAVADRLLHEVTDDLPLDWRGMTVPGEEDRTSYRTGVIGLRCPARGFWSLPVALHEMGHVVAQTLQVREPGRPPYNPVRDLLVAGGSRQQREELFADFFATLSLGAAYPAAVLLTRFDPQDCLPQLEFEDEPTADQTHPSVDKRAHLVLGTLDRMDRSAGLLRHPYRTAWTCLQRAWEEQARSVDVQAQVPESSAKRLDAVLNGFWPLAGTTLRPARHAASAQEPVVEAFLRGGADLPEPSRATIRDVVSAAWRVRCTDQEARVGDIEERGRSLAEMIIKEAS
jgi:hypothetical protein